MRALLDEYFSEYAGKPCIEASPGMCGDFGSTISTADYAANARGALPAGWGLPA